MQSQKRLPPFLEFDFDPIIFTNPKPIDTHPAIFYLLCLLCFFFFFYEKKMWVFFFFLVQSPIENGVEIEIWIKVKFENYGGRR